MLGGVAVACVAAGLLAAHHVEWHLRERAEDARGLPDGGRRGAVRLEPFAHALRVTLGLDLVVLQLLQDRRIVRRGDHPVEHAQDVLLHRMRLVDVFDQLLFQLSHRFQPPQFELAELATQ